MAPACRVLNLAAQAAAAPGLAALILAAGGGSRFGGAKPLALFRGLTLVERAAREALRVCGAGTVVVTGADGIAVAGAVASLPVITTDNPSWQSGQSTSLAAGIHAVPRTANALLVLLCDQPLVDGADLDALVASARRSPDRVIAAHYGAVTGVPAIFPKAFWPALQALRGDSGARLLIATLNPAMVEIPHAAEDVDTPADLARLSGHTGA